MWVLCVRVALGSIGGRRFAISGLLIVRLFARWVFPRDCGGREEGKDLGKEDEEVKEEETGHDALALVL